MFPSRHLILIGGFTQSTRTTWGLVKLFPSLWQAVKGSGAFLWQPQTWHIDIEAAVGLIRNAGMDAQCMIVGYSYGGGKAVILTRRLAEFNIAVPFLILIDPVPRWRYLPGLAAVLGWLPLGFGSIFRRAKSFVIPPNVDRCRVYVQRRAWPFGFPAVPQWPEKTTVEESELDYKHEDMDDADIVHRKILAWAQQFAQYADRKAA